MYLDKSGFGAEIKKTLQANGIKDGVKVCIKITNERLSNKILFEDDSLRIKLQSKPFNYYRPGTEFVLTKSVIQNGATTVDVDESLQIKVISTMREYAEKFGKAGYYYGKAQSNLKPNIIQIACSKIHTIGFPYNNTVTAKANDIAQLGSSRGNDNLVRVLNLFGVGFKMRPLELVQVIGADKIEVLKDTGKINRDYIHFYNSNDVAHYVGSYKLPSSMKARFPQLSEAMPLRVRRNLNARNISVGISGVTRLNSHTTTKCVAKGYANYYNAFVCGVCEEVHERQNYVNDHWANMRFNGHDNFYDDVLICDACWATDAITHCETCNTHYATELQFEGGCPSCNYDGSWTVNNWNYTPHLRFHSEAGDDNLFLGIELEMEELHNDEVCELTLKALTNETKELAYAMSDGSLSNGFEIATMPATLNAHMNSAKFDYDKYCEVADSNGLNSTGSSCGIHVHMSRDFFGSASTERLFGASKMALIMEKNWDDFTKFARRTYSRYSKKGDMLSKGHFENERDALTEFDNKYRCQGKYIALNTQHSQTFELRIFQGTLDALEIKATLQFVDNLARIAKASSLAKAQILTMDDIINYEPHAELVEYWNSL